MPSPTTPDVLLSDSDAPPEAVPERFRAGCQRITRRLGEQRTEVLFVTLTFLGMMLGLVADWQGWAPALRWAGYGAAYVFGGYYGVRAGLEALRDRAVDIDLLMILAALGALVIGAPFEGAMLLFLFSLSNVLEGYATGRSRRAIGALMELRPEAATVRRGEAWVVLPLAEVAPGEIYVVRPGERLPLDGLVERGRSEVDEATLTGESVPAEKAPGAEVFGGTINGTGSLEVRVTRRAGASAIDRLIALVEEAQSEKAETQRLLDRFEQPYVLGVLGLTAAAVALPTLALGEAFAPAFYRAMTLMVAASPCALIISTPAAVLSAIANGARRGVLFKGGAHVEAAAAIRAVAFDKTGTLTAGRTALTDVLPLAEASEDEVLALAAAVQARSEHHLARATVEAARARGLEVPAATGFQAAIGRGVRAEVGAATVHIGNAHHFEGAPAGALAEAFAAAARLEEEGKTAVVVAREAGGRLEALGLTAFADTLRPGAAAVVADLRRLGIERVVMLTGDNRHVAERIAAEAGIEEVHAELLPEQKVEIVRALREHTGPTAMVGDGVNDAPALAAASLGVAMGAAGTDVALETADLVLMSDALDRLAYAIALGRRARRTLVVNLAVALGMIVLMVATILTVGLPLPLAVVGHEGSTVLVSLNGLRLLGFRRRD